MLIATDLDGTLVPHGQGAPGDYTARVLRRADDAGVPVVLVTARPLRWMDRMWPHVGGHGLAIVSNGAITYDVAAGEAVAVDGIDPAEGLALAAAIREAVPGAGFGLECVDGLRLDDVYQEVEHLVPEGTPIGPLEQVWDAPAVKVLVREPSMTTEDLHAAVAAAVGDTAIATFSSPGLIEISAPGVTKASALARLCARLGVDAAEVVAFGDMPNDLPMLSWAGTAYAVADAHPSVLVVAENVAPPSSEEGVAQVVEQLLAARAEAS